MATVSDHMMLLKSKEQLYEPVFEKSAWLYVNDTNQSYESSTSVIETGALSNSNKYMIYNKAYISLPFLVTITGAVGYDVTEVAIKQSFLSLVNSITVDLNGTNVVQQNQLIDIVNHYQILTQESVSSSPRWATIGLGELAERTALLDLGGDITNPRQTTLSQAELQKLHQSNKSVYTETVTQYSARAIIYLKDLHPIFQSIPISKALNFKIQLFWNSCITSLNKGATSAIFSLTNPYRPYNGTIPIEVTDDLYQRAINGPPNASILVSLYIGDKCYASSQTSVAGVASGNVGNQVQLWVPSCQMKEAIETDYINTNAVKTVKYLDYYQYTINDIGASSTFNKLVSNGVSNLKSVLIVPFTADDKENVSPIDSGLPKAFGHLGNLQVLVGGSNVLANDLRYSFHTFAQEFLNSFGVNGNESAGLGSGLIGYKEWFKNPYYFIDCSRVPDELTKSYRSLQITGTNVTTTPTELVVFAFYERSFKLNTINGQIEAV